MKVPLIPLCTAVFCIVGGVHAAVVQVQAGPNSQLVFSPDTVTANVGDTVNFQMVGALHTVAQSPGRLNGPCDTGSGFDSGPTHGVFLDVAPLPAPLVVTPIGACSQMARYTLSTSHPWTPSMCTARYVTTLARVVPDPLIILLASSATLCLGYGHDYQPRPE